MDNFKNHSACYAKITNEVSNKYPSIKFRKLYIKLLLRTCHVLCAKHGLEKQNPTGQMLCSLSYGASVIRMSFCQEKENADVTEKLIK